MAIIHSDMIVISSFFRSFQLYDNESFNGIVHFDRSKNGQPLCVSTCNRKPKNMPEIQVLSLAFINKMVSWHVKRKILIDILKYMHSSLIHVH